MPSPTTSDEYRTNPAAQFKQVLKSNNFNAAHQHISTIDDSLKTLSSFNVFPLHDVIKSGFDDHDKMQLITELEEKFGAKALFSSTDTQGNNALHAAYSSQSISNGVANYIREREPGLKDRQNHAGQVPSAICRSYVHLGDTPRQEDNSSICTLLQKAATACRVS